MKINILKETILPALLRISGIVGRRQTLPILGSILVKLKNGSLTFIATDLEVEVVTSVLIETEEEGEVTIPARKFLDICKSLPDGSKLEIEANGEKTRIISGKSKFILSSLPAREFPSLEVSSPQLKFDLKEEKLKELIKKTAFAMAHQDVRYYLNGMLIEISKNEVKGIATDGHRLAMCTKTIDASVERINTLLVPRKAVSELDRLLEWGTKKVSVQLFSNVARFKIDETSLTTKLIDGKFPDYSRVIPTLCEKKAVIDKECFKNALVRTSILSSDRYKGIRVSLDRGLLKIQAHNPEQEEAEEEMEVEYEEDSMTIGFNVGYLLDILATMDSERILLEFSTTSKSSIIKALDCSDCLYVVMPMRL